MSGPSPPAHPDPPAPTRGRKVATSPTGPVRVTARQATSVGDLRAHRDRWRELAEATDGGFFRTWEWMAAWWEVYGEGRPITVLVRGAGSDTGRVPPLHRGPSGPPPPGAGRPAPHHHRRLDGRGRRSPRPGGRRRRSPRRALASPALAHPWRLPAPGEPRPRRRRGATAGHPSAAGDQPGPDPLDRPVAGLDARRAVAPEAGEGGGAARAADDRARDHPALAPARPGERGRGPRPAAAARGEVALPGQLGDVRPVPRRAVPEAGALGRSRGGGGPALAAGAGSRRRTGRHPARPPPRHPLRHHEVGLEPGAAQPRVGPAAPRRRHHPGPGPRHGALRPPPR